jgi:hypothetical protein
MGGNYGVAQYILKADVLYATTQHVPKGDIAELSIYPESYPGDYAS